MQTRISSQLMLYRLCTLFGMPPQRTIDPTTQDAACWFASLGYYRGAEPSWLQFSEFNGGAKCYFTSNSIEASDAAIELVNLLVRCDLSHLNSYEGYYRIVAGRRFS